jgi:hypothetical protein
MINDIVLMPKIMLRKNFQSASFAKKKLKFHIYYCLLDSLGTARNIKQI